MLQGFARRTRLLRLGRDLLADELRVPLKAPGRKDDRHAVGELGQRPAQPHVARAAGKNLGEPHRIEADT